MLETGFIDKYYYRFWKNGSLPNANVFAIHGFGGHSIWFDKAGELFNKHNINFFSFDLPGFGQSNFTRGNIDSYNEWLRAVEDLYKNFSSNLSNDKPTFILGHSMGALLATIISSRLNPPGTILTVPGFEGAGDSWTPGLIAKILFSSIFLPNKEIFVPFGPDKLTKNKDIIRDLKRDELRVISPRAKMFLQLKLLGFKAKKACKDLSCKTLMIQAKEDLVCSNDAMDIAFENITAVDKEKKLYEDLYHDIFLENELPKIVDDIAYWIAT